MKAMALFFLAAALALPTPAASSAVEDDLKRFFEGRVVILEVEMPATDDGVNVYPERSNPLDYAELAGRLKKHGTALFVGDQTIITKVKIKKKHIEFQLAGGGFGTFLDGIGPAIDIPDVPKSKREKFLEEAVREEQDPKVKRKLELELAEERDAREAEERHNKAQAARAAEIRRIHVRQLALEGGSRFNIRFDRAVPAEALTPAAIMGALEPWVEFPWRFVAEGTADPPAAPVALPGLFSNLRKGLLMDDVNAIMEDRPRAERRRLEGSLGVTEWLYDAAPGRVEMTFVEGVLVRFGFASSWVEDTDGKPERLEPEKAAFRRLR